MSRKRRKNKSKRSSDSDDCEQPLYVCRCQKVFTKRNNAESKESPKPVFKKWSSETDQGTDGEINSCKDSTGIQTELLTCEEGDQEEVCRVEDETEGGKSASAVNMTQNVDVTDNSTLPTGEKSELPQNLDESVEEIATQVKANCIHMNFTIKNRQCPRSRTQILITNKKTLTKSRSYHDRQHQQSQQSGDCRWDFAGYRPGKDKIRSMTKKKRSERPLVKLEIIGEGIEVKCKTINNNLIFHIEAGKVHNQKDDFQVDCAQNTTDYVSREGSCNSYPVSDFSVHERNKQFARSVSPEWYLDVPPPEEFADEKEKCIDPTPVDEALLFEDSVKESYSLPSISPCWWELENHDQANDEYCIPETTAEVDEGLCLQYMKKCAECSQRTSQSDKAKINTFPFISKQELKLGASRFCHKSKSDCCFDAKVLRRRTVPEMFYDPYRAYNHFRESFFDTEDHPFMSTVCPELFGPSNANLDRRHRYFPTVELERSLSSSPFSSTVGIPNDHLFSKSDYMKTGLQSVETDTFIDDVPSTENHPDGNILTEDIKSDTCSPYPLYLDTVDKTVDEDEDFEDLMQHTFEQIDFAESGFDEEILDSDNHTDYPESLNKGFLIQVTPPSRSTSKEHVFEKSNHNETPSEPLHNIELKKDVCQSGSTDSDIPTRKRKGSVVTVVTGDLEQRLLIQGDSQALSEAIASRAQRELLKDSKQSCIILRDSVLTPVPDVEEQELDLKLNSSFEDQNPYTFKHISSQTSETFDPFLSIEKQCNEADVASIRANEGICSEREESNDMSDNFQQDTSPRNSSDSAMPGTSFESMTYQNSRLVKSDSEEYSRKNSESKDIAQEKPGSPRKKTCKTDKRSEIASKHLKLPMDTVLKETRDSGSMQEETSDRWAKKRKQFKETKNYNSAGGSSLTSILTEESGNSEESRSAETGVRAENKDKGLYTESFHSAAWIFRGDDAGSENSPRCLSKRSRSVAIRERTVRITKGTGDYPWGFRIQFSKPILVTEVDTNGPAEEAGLQVGDIVMAVNGTDVTSIPHSEAATLARQGPDLLTLVVGTDISRIPNTPRPTCRGYLHKRTHSGLFKGWRKRWFVLKHDGTLQYYKHKNDEGKSRPLEITNLEGSEIGVDTTLGKPFVFRCAPLSANRIYYFCATSNQEMKRWLDAMDKAIHPLSQNHVWVDVTMHNFSLPPLAIKNPECLGLLHQLDKNKDVWVQHYCILKDGCLYFYSSIRSTNALGGIYLQGYTVFEQSVNSKRCIIELRPPSEEFKTFYLSAGNAAENKRWITSLKISINKWLPLHQAIQDFMSRPLEETRM
ncbi:uncharacterized protein LOC134612390 isoform X2 [Pelobates fuscus]|uniref:uncharacterized protein LOC134612390 isoform X2 n=1 Tax=Pelobates fuscus TaxID=191477 RepID=UPI002FE42E55